MTKPESAYRQFVVDEQTAGIRVDRIVTARYPELGRRHVAQLFQSGAILINGRAGRAKGQVAKSGDQVHILGASSEQLSVAARPEPDALLAVLFESRHVVVVSKPPGQPTAPRDSQEGGTLANALVGHYPEMQGIGYRDLEPGLLHRLDNDTSGLLVAARTPLAFSTLREALVEESIDKVYLAIVEASPNLAQHGVIDSAIGPGTGRRSRVRTYSANELPKGARSARTTWRIAERSGSFWLLELKAARAYRHQIRAHLASVGHPIVGDAVYGGLLTTSLARRHALHAAQIAWTGNATVPSFFVVDPLADDLRCLLTTG